MLLTPYLIWMGSSPRVRGSHTDRILQSKSLGIIPAGAGLTVIVLSEYKIPWDHPRGCGAHLKLKDVATMLSGSSPRVRGSLERVVRVAVEDGIIPAGAGLTFQFLRRDDLARDHPRGCGAHGAIIPGFGSCMGSSPRVRGSQKRRNKMATKKGIIPAGAGLTRRATHFTAAQWDHPRGCGAHLRLTEFDILELGSSPRVRGSPLSQKVLTFAPGIIPAGAGLTSKVP